VNIPARIEARLVPEPNTGCLIWEGGADRKGYGIVWFQGKKHRVNRVLHFLRTGRWPRRDFEMLHSCDTPRCGEERHLSPGTRRRNARERQERGRTRGIRAYGKVG
jgi:hypothetical protein